jgi:signal transduction histidine kinase
MRLSPRLWFSPPYIADRGVRLAFSLAVAIAIPVGVLFVFQYRALASLESTSAVVLRQLSTDTVDTAARAIETALKEPHIKVLLALPQARVEPLDPAFVAPVLTDGLEASPFIDAFYIWTRPSAADVLSGRWLTFDAQSANMVAAVPADRFRDNPASRRALLGKLQQLASLKRAIVAFSDTIDGRPHYVQAQLRWSSPARDELTSLVAFAVDAERLRTEFIPTLLATRLQSLQQPSGFPPLRLALEDGDRRLVVAGHGPDDTFVDARTFPLVFFDKELLEFAAPYEARRENWQLRTTYGANDIPAVVNASTRPQKALMGVVGVLMSIGVFLVVRAAAREVRVAELKSNFVASVSHDLKTPLALIQLFAETLELGRVKNPDRAQEYYRIINLEARKLTRLIENILDFSRMEAGLRPYTKQPEDIGVIVDRVVDMMAPQFTQGKFSVTVHRDEPLPAVMADVLAVERAVENLLTNALKYSGESKQIDIAVVTAGQQVQVRISDHGIGIPRQEQRRIFRKFYRVQQELGGGPQGTGLGLAIVEHTMRGHGGSVSVDSTPGVGSQFTLHFPIDGTLTDEDVRHETDSGNRRRTADAPGPA